MPNSISQYIGDIQAKRAEKLRSKMEAILPFIDYQIQKKSTEEAEAKRRTKVETDISGLATGYGWSPEESQKWVNDNKGISTDSLPASFELAHKQRTINGDATRLGLTLPPDMDTRNKELYVEYAKQASLNGPDAIAYFREEVAKGTPPEEAAALANTRFKKDEKARDKQERLTEEEETKRRNYSDSLQASTDQDADTLYQKLIGEGMDPDLALNKAKTDFDERKKKETRQKLETDLRTRAKLHGYTDQEMDEIFANNANLSDRELENIIDISYKNKGVDERLRMYGVQMPKDATPASKQEMIDSLDKAADLGEWGLAKFKEKASNPDANLRTILSDVKQDVTYRENVEQKFGSSSNTYIKKYDELRAKGSTPAEAYGRVAKFWEDNQPKGSGGSGGGNKDNQKSQQELENATIKTEKDRNGAEHSYVYYYSDQNVLIKVPVFKNRNGQWMYVDQPNMAVDLAKVLDYKSIKTDNAKPGRKTATQNSNSWDQYKRK